VTNPIRVMLVDDHALVRMGFRMMLNDAGIDVAAEADSGEQACQVYPQVRPDVVMMDLSMPGMGGLEALKRLLAADEQARVLVLSAHEDHAHPKRALRGGAMGYLAKRSAPDEMIAAVRAAAQGRRYVDAQTAQNMALASGTGQDNPEDILSEREFSVFLMLAKGSSVAAIADALHLAPSTVGTHLYNVKQKLNASNQSELTLLALQWGLLRP
jgi:two-component system, NarL family, invasion response regulator UvrY